MTHFDLLSVCEVSVWVVELSSEAVGNLTPRSFSNSSISAGLSPSCNENYVTLLVQTDILAAVEENHQSAYAKTKAQISFAVNAKLNSAYVFATWIIQFLSYLNPNFQASSLFCDCAAWFVSDLFGNHIVGFLVLRLKLSNTIDPN